MSSLQFSHVILPVGSGSCTRFELSLTELRNVRDTYSRYCRSYESKPRGVRHSLVLGRGSARLEASYVGQSHGKNAYGSCSESRKRLRPFSCHVYFMDYRRIFSGPWQSDHAVRHKNSACQYALAMWGPGLGLAPWLGCAAGHSHVMEV